MRLLLDTHAFLWWRLDDPALGAETRAALADRGNTVLISAAAAWEIVIKRALGKLEFEGSVSDAIAEDGFEPLPITPAHVDEVAALPDLHRDPFDRMLVAQARCEGLTLVTRDPAILAYRGFGSLEI
ncbi:MAG: type II toxin-antitoxin system VapC family toxin [Armatimonadetes bacterium]|nr:type II toxin-antitoxin system VapC family toxin [Armatimonadota bacterium]